MFLNELDHFYHNFHDEWNTTLNAQKGNFHLRRRGATDLKRQRGGGGERTHWEPGGQPWPEQEEEGRPVVQALTTTETDTTHGSLVDYVEFSPRPLGICGRICGNFISFPPSPSPLCVENSTYDFLSFLSPWHLHPLLYCFKI